MTFTNEEVLECFEPVVNPTLEMININMVAVEATGHAVKVRKFRIIISALLEKIAS
jgi:hypothetical protein